MELGNAAFSIAAFVFGVFSVLWTPNDNPDKFKSGFSTKTAYRHCDLHPFRDDSDKRLKDSCKLVHINALFRHGTRSPSRKNVADFEQLYERLIQSKDAKLPPGFIGYPVPFKHVESKVLLPMGLTELYNLGQTFRRRAQSSFSFHRSNIRFLSSSIERAAQSAHSFYHGFFGLRPLTPHDPPNSCSTAEAESQPHPSLVANNKRIKCADHDIRFFDYCKRYIIQIEKNKSCSHEIYQYRKGLESRALFNQIMEAHNLRKDDFSVDDVYTLYQACAFETAANEDSEPLSPWCGFFRTDQLPIVEYRVELKHYWLRSYGYELNYLQSCPLVSQMLTQIRDMAVMYKSVLSSPNKTLASELHRATFWFGHAETVLPVVAAFGLFNDSVGHENLQRLRAKNFLKWLMKRQSDPAPPTMFRAAHIAPFAGNIALFLYYCPDSDSLANSDDPFAGFYVQPEVNGRTVAWPIGSPVQPPTAEHPGATSAPLSLLLNHFRSCMPGVYNDTKVCKADQLVRPVAGSS